MEKLPFGNSGKICLTHAKRDPENGHFADGFKYKKVK